MSQTDVVPRPCTRILPPVWFLLAVISEAALHRFVPLARVIWSPWNFGGAVLIVLGAASALLGNARFRARGTTVRPNKQPTALVTDGIYRFTRNPMYLGMVLILAGIALCLGSLSPWAVPILFALFIQHCFIRAEETALANLFGDAFNVYRGRVRRWV
jgi:protein-S-isoprenylcysteine O-methyltransferase Ste14